MKRKTSLIVWGAVLLLAAYGIYDLVREVRRYTSCYAHTYSHAIGQMMGPRFDSLTPRGEGIRIGVVDAGFGGLRDDRFTRRLRVADYLDLTDGDTTDSSATTATTAPGSHGTSGASPTTPCWGWPAKPTTTW